MRANDLASYNISHVTVHGHDHVHHHRANLEVKITISQNAIFGTGKNHENYVRKYLRKSKEGRKIANPAIIEITC